MVAALVATAVALVIAPVRLGGVWRALAVADAHGWQVLLVLVALTPVAMAVGWLALSSSVWPWTLALTAWLVTLAILAGRLHHWVTMPMTVGLGCTAVVSLTAMAFVWSRPGPRR